MENVSLTLNLSAEDQQELQNRSRYTKGDIDSLCAAIKSIQEFAVQRKVSLQAVFVLGETFANDVADTTADTQTA